MAKLVITVIVEAIVLAFGDCGSTAITGDKKLSLVIKSYHWSKVAAVKIRRCCLVSDISGSDSADTDVSIYGTV